MDPKSLYALFTPTFLLSWRMGGVLALLIRHILKEGKIKNIEKWLVEGESFRQALSAYENTEKGPHSKIMIDSPDGGNFRSYVSSDNVPSQLWIWCGSRYNMLIARTSYNEMNQSIFRAKTGNPNHLDAPTRAKDHSADVVWAIKGGGSQTQ